MENYTKEQVSEIKKCAESFPYFCKYVKIKHPKRGVIEFELYQFQKDLIKHYEHNRFTILKKFRYGGFTTATVLWALWRCMFKMDQRIMFTSYREDMVVAIKKMLDIPLFCLPDFLKPELKINNEHELNFEHSGSSMYFHTTEAGRGLRLDYLIIDEAVFIKNMKQHWQAMYPCLSCGGTCIVLSTPNKKKGWFYDTYMDAWARGEDPGKCTPSAWTIFETDYRKHPDYTDEFCANLKGALGEDGWKQEVLAEFLDN